jgi:hypothetical protein
VAARKSYWLILSRGSRELRQTALTDNKAAGHSARRHKYRTFNKVSFDVFYVATLCGRLLCSEIIFLLSEYLFFSSPFLSFIVSFYFLCVSLFFFLRHMLPLPLQPSPKARCIVRRLVLLITYTNPIILFLLYFH